MFTGIVEELGAVSAIEREADAIRITIIGPLVVSDAGPGASIAVNGCCLTVSDLEVDKFTADVMAETLAKTSLGALEVGSKVNLERALSPTSRLGGHVVQGHVDGAGSILRRTPSENWEIVEIAMPVELARYVVPKGSITVDGISLTVVEVAEESFTVSLIPETLARTTLGFKEVGDPVNLEADVIAKYLEKLVAR
jgi:riboflavin synthase